jgi:hypothetical protein
MILAGPPKNHVTKSQELNPNEKSLSGSAELYIGSMKGFLLLLALTTVAFVSCNGDRPHVEFPTIPADNPPVIVDPYAPDSICLFKREKAGTVIGDWVEVARVDGSIISETDCITMDTVGFATRWERRWVFVNDSIVKTYWQDVHVKNDGSAFTVSGQQAQVWTYEMRGVNDTILMLDHEHMYRDTLRITCLKQDTLILASVRYKWAFKPPEVKSVVYVRRK